MECSENESKLNVSLTFYNFEQNIHITLVTYDFYYHTKKYNYYKRREI